MENLSRKVDVLSQGLQSKHVKVSDHGKEEPFWSHNYSARDGYVDRVMTDHEHEVRC